MTQAEWMADRHALLAELASIEEDLAALESIHGVYPETVSLRDRIHAARGHVQRQLAALLDGADATAAMIH